MKINESFINLFKELESILLNQGTRINSEKLNELIADDFIEFGVSGNIYNKKSAIETLKNESFIKRNITDFNVMQLSKDVVLITYFTQQDKAEKNPKVDSLRSSIWKKYGSHWKIVFHQGTEISKKYI